MFAYDVCVIGGCGRVGLPLSLAFARLGKKVLIHDVDSEALRRLGGASMPFRDKGWEPVLKKELHRHLFLTDDPDACATARFVVVAIGAEAKENEVPATGPVRDFVAGLLPRLIDGQILILRSTVPPGTMDACKGMVESSGRKIGVAYCPERVAEGNSIGELYRLPQIVASDDPDTFAGVAELFGRLAPEVIELTPGEAELAKLFSNAYRYIHFSIANAFSMLAAERGADFKKISDAMTRNYPRNRSFPAPGFVGGPCLLKDTSCLSGFFESFGLGREAMRVNQGMPAFVADVLMRSEALESKVVGILGMAFKPECDDMRNSQSLELAARLKRRCKELICSDEYVEAYASVSAEELIRRSDVIVIACPHGRYRDLDYGGKRVIDLFAVLA